MHTFLHVSQFMYFLLKLMAIFWKHESGDPLVAGPFPTKCG